MILIDGIDPASKPPAGFALGNKALKVEDIKNGTLGNLESLKNIYQTSTKVLNAVFNFQLHGAILKFKGPGKDKVENVPVVKDTLTDFAKRDEDLQGKHPHVVIIHKVKEDLMKMITDLEAKKYGTAAPADKKPGE